MPKKILFESAVHQFLTAARHVGAALGSRPQSEFASWQAFVSSLHFRHLPNGVMEVRWTSPGEGCALVSYRDASFYVRGDTGEHVDTQRERGLVFSADEVMRRNEQLFAERLREVAVAAGLSLNMATPR